MPRISIELTRYGTAGWEWTERYQTFIGPVEFSYRTDEMGQGLWLWEDPEALDHWDDEAWIPQMAWTQLEDTCHFALPPTRGPAYSKIRRLLVKILGETREEV